MSMVTTTVSQVVPARDAAVQLGPLHQGNAHEMHATSSGLAGMPDRHHFADPTSMAYRAPVGRGAADD
jgi:hypothetical protein